MLKGSAKMSCAEQEPLYNDALLTYPLPPRGD
jgi:hypothetical protein